MDQLMQLGSVGFWGTILIGILAGWIGEKVTGSDHGLIKNLIFGIVGSFIGFYVANVAGLQLGEFFSGWFWGNLIVSAAGAIALLSVFKILGGKKR
jgi:uncharacterized membrane protein YeaQ/YmgE (transglycosylase-associated protein family)